MEAVKCDTEKGAATRPPRGVDKAPTLRTAALHVLMKYVSKRNGDVGVDAFLADRLHDNPDFFLTQLVKLEPKSVAVESTVRSLTVVMHVDGAPEPMCLEGAPEAPLDQPSNATYQCLSDVVAEADKVEAPPQRTTGGGSRGRKTGPIQADSRPLTAPTPETSRPLSPHISKPSEVVSDFSKFKNSVSQPPWHPNVHAITHCPRCGAPVEYKGLVRNLPSYLHPVEGGEPVLLRHWARCPNQGGGKD